MYPTKALDWRGDYVSWHEAMPSLGRVLFRAAFFDAWLRDGFDDEFDAGVRALGEVFLLCLDRKRYGLTDDAVYEHRDG